MSGVTDSFAPLPSHATAEPSAETTGLLLPPLPCELLLALLTSVVAWVSRLRSKMSPPVAFTPLTSSDPPEANTTWMPSEAIIGSWAPLAVPLVPSEITLTICVDGVGRVKVRT